MSNLTRLPKYTVLFFVGAMFLLRSVGADDPAPEGNPKLWKKHYTAGTDALRKNDNQTAFQQFRLALADSESFTGRDSYKRVQTLEQLGGLLLQSREYEKAAAVLKKALELWTSAEKNKEVERAGLLIELASAYQYGEKYEDAEKAAKEGIRIFESKVGRYKPVTALAKGELGSIYRGMKRYTEAEDLFTEALKTVQSPQYNTTMEPDGSVTVYRYRPIRTQIANIQNDFAGLYLDWGKMDKAEGLFKESLSYEEAEFGKEHLNTLTPLMNLTLLNFRKKDFPNAEAYGKRSVHVAEKSIGLTDAHGFQTLSTLAAIYFRDSKRSDYEAIATQLRKIETESHSRSLLTAVMVDTAYPEAESSDWDAVEKIYQTFLPEFETAYGKSDPRAIAGLEVLQKFYATYGRKAESDKLYEELLVRKAKQAYK